MTIDIDEIRKQLREGGGTHVSQEVADALAEKMMVAIMEKKENVEPIFEFWDGDRHYLIFVNGRVEGGNISRIKNEIDPALRQALGVAYNAGPVVFKSMLGVLSTWHRYDLGNLARLR